jgi:hypothetical protein
MCKSCLNFDTFFETLLYLIIFVRNNHMKRKPTLVQAHKDNSCEQSPSEDLSWSWGLHCIKCFITDPSTILTEINASLLKILNVMRYSYYFGRLGGLVARVPGYRFRGPRSDSRRYQIFWEVVGVERGPLSLVRITEELLERTVAAPV